MIELTWIPEALALLPYVWAGLFAVTLGLALFLPRRWPFKAVGLIVVLSLWSYVYKRDSTDADERQRQLLAERQRVKAKLDESLALFNERCKSSGEKIHRTVDNVEGVVWMKWRPQSANLENQFKMDDPYGSDCWGEGCIAQLLRVISGAHLAPLAAERNRHGYQFVESIDRMDGKRYRYTAVIKSVRQRTPEQREQATRNNGGIDPGPDIYDFALERQPIETFTARYGITWDDISTQEDRQHWIAGGSLKVIDLKTAEVIAERVGFMIDRGQGDKSGSRAPWSFAKQSACPAYRGGRHGHPVTENTAFAFKVLQRKQGE